MNESTAAISPGAPPLIIRIRIHLHDDPPVHTLRSPVWRRGRGSWRMVFHQGTKTAPPSSVS